MKKSTMLLILALTIPVLATGAGIADSLRNLGQGGDGAAGGGGGTKDPFGVLDDGPVQTIYEGVVPVATALQIKADAARVEARFDPTLNGEARVKVEAADKNAASMRLDERALTFSGGEGRSSLRVTLALPARFESLELEMNASRCDFIADTPVQIGTLRIVSNAAACDLTLTALQAQRLETQVNAGKVDLDMEDLAVAQVEATVSAGKLDWKVGRLRFEGEDRHGWQVRNSAGKTAIDVREAPALTAVMRSSLGAVELRRGENVERIEGLNEERRIEADAGAPEIVLEAQMGRIEAVFGR